MNGWIMLRDVDGGTEDTIHIADTTQFEFFGHTVSPDSVLAWALLHAEPHERVTTFIDGKRRRLEIVEVQRIYLKLAE